MSDPDLEVPRAAPSEADGGVLASSGAPGKAGGSNGQAASGLRVRPPSPLAPRTRAAVGAVAALALVIGAVLVVQAGSDDGGTHPGAAWDGHPLPPRGAKLDAFDTDGPLGRVDGFGIWSSSARFRAADGLVESQSVGGDGEAGASTFQFVAGDFARVDAGSSDALVYVQVGSAPAGTAIVLSATAPGQPLDGLFLFAGDGSWHLDRVRLQATQRLGTFEAPTRNVAVQVVRRGDEVKVQFDTKGFAAPLPADAPTSTQVGVFATGPGARFDLFGYLPLPAG